jgi:hypothetical protein
MFPVSTEVSGPGLKGPGGIPQSAFGRNGHVPFGPVSLLLRNLLCEVEVGGHDHALGKCSQRARVYAKTLENCQSSNQQDLNGERVTFGSSFFGLATSRLKESAAKCLRLRGESERLF